MIGAGDGGLWLISKTNFGKSGNWNRGFSLAAACQMRLIRWLHFFGGMEGKKKAGGEDGRKVVGRSIKLHVWSWTAGVCRKLLYFPCGPHLGRSAICQESRIRLFFAVELVEQSGAGSKLEKWNATCVEHFFFWNDKLRAFINMYVKSNFGIKLLKWWLHT